MEKKQHLMQDKSMRVSCCFPSPYVKFSVDGVHGERDFREELQPSDRLRPGAALFASERRTVTEGSDHHRKWQLEGGGGIR